MSMLTVAAVLTCHRTDTLRATIEELRLQMDEVPGARLLVVDNDDQPRAETIVEAVADRDPRVRYVHEPSPGIAAARNRALDTADDVDLLAFIDDDVPGEHWLARLVATWIGRQQPTAVVGPVVHVLEADPDPWLSAGEFFGEAHHLTGEEVGAVGTDNLLLDMHEVRRRGLRFDPAIDDPDESESVFARTLCEHGSRVVWCEEAVVFDAVPAERATRSWWCHHAARVGETDQRVLVRLAAPGIPRWRTRIGGTVAGGTKVALGAARLGYGRLVGSVRDEAVGTRTLLCGAGMVHGSWASAS